MKYNQKALFNEIIRFYLVTTNGEELSRIRALMGSLVRKARTAILENADEKEKIHHLLQLVYGDWGFHCDPDHYFELENLYLNKVLLTKSGMPVILGAIVLYLADSLKLPIYPVNFPTQLLLRADVNEEVAFINPWNGEYVSQETLSLWYEGYMGFGQSLSEQDLAIADPQELSFRFNQVAKNALIREGHDFEAFEYIKLLLQENPDDPYEIRDRGLVLVNMDCISAGVQDLDYFIQHCPDDPTAILLNMQLPSLKQITNQIH